MFELIKTNVIFPALGRVGTVLGTTLVGWGMHQDHATQVVAGLIAGAGFALDLAWSKWGRNRAKTQGAREALSELVNRDYRGVGGGQ